MRFLLFSKNYFVLACVFLFGSCSWIVKIPVRVPKGISEWAAGEDCYHYYHPLPVATHSYNIQRDGISFSICSCPRRGEAILIGPPLLPVIPNFLPLFRSKLDDERFFINFKIVNANTDAIRINVWEILFFQNQKQLIPSRIFLISKSSAVNMHYRDIKNFESDTSKSLPTSSFITINSADSIAIHFEFSVMTTQIKKITIKINGVTGRHDIPDLRLRIKNKFIYRPAYMELS